MQCARKGHAAVEMMYIAYRRFEDKQNKKSYNIGSVLITSRPYLDDKYYQCPTCFTIVRERRYWIVSENSSRRPTNEDCKEFNLPRQIIIEEVNKIPEDAMPSDC
jgi:hypothetical protein